MVDFHCECNDGYKAVEKDGGRTGVNPDDCPAGACAPGTCEDLLNGCDCDGPTGYDVLFAAFCIQYRAGRNCKVEHEACRTRAGPFQRWPTRRRRQMAWCFIIVNAAGSLTMLNPEGSLRCGTALRLRKSHTRTGGVLAPY